MDMFWGPQILREKVKSAISLFGKKQHSVTSLIKNLKRTLCLSKALSAFKYQTEWPGKITHSLRVRVGVRVVRHLLGEQKERPQGRRVRAAHLLRPDPKPENPCCSGLKPVPDCWDSDPKVGALAGEGAKRRGVAAAPREPASRCGEWRLRLAWPHTVPLLPDSLSPSRVSGCTTYMIRSDELGLNWQPLRKSRLEPRANLCLSFVKKIKGRPGMKPHLSSVWVFLCCLELPRPLVLGYLTHASGLSYTAVGSPQVSARVRDRLTTGT